MWIIFRIYGTKLKVFFLALLKIIDSWSIQNNETLSNYIQVFLFGHYSYWFAKLRRSDARSLFGESRRADKPYLRSISYTFGNINSANRSGPWRHCSISSNVQRECQSIRIYWNWNYFCKLFEKLLRKIKRIRTTKRNLV